MSAFGRPQPRRPADHRRVLDIEDALRWAYRDELPKQQHSSGLGAGSSISPMFRMAAFGGPIDNWSREPGFPAAAGDPHPDAVVIGTHVQRLERFAGHVLDGDSGLMMGGLPIDERAVLRYATTRMVGLVMVNAKLRARPTWSELPRPRAAIGPNGKPAVLRVVMRPDPFGKLTVPEEVACPPLRKNYYPAGAYCPLVWDPDPGEIATERAEYLAWWMALDILAGELAGGLTSIAVLPPSAPRLPWAGDREAGKPPPLFSALREPLHRQETHAAAAARRQLGARRERPRMARATAPKGAGINHRRPRTWTSA